MESINPIFNRSIQVDEIKEVHFQALSWYAADVEKEDNADELQYEIYICGVNLGGQSVALRVLGFMPYFYVNIPESWTSNQAELFFKGIKYKLYKESYGLVDYEIVRRKKLFPYLANKKFKFIKFIFNTDKAFTKCKWLFSDKNQDEHPIKISGIDGVYYEPYETNVDHITRFCHIRDIETTGWIRVENFTEDMEYSTAQINITADCNDINFDPDTKSIAPFMIFSWDIECLPENTEEMPNENNEGDVISQVSVVLNKYGNPEIQKFIFTSSPCSPIEDSIIISTKNEKELLEAFCEFIKIVDPDILTGFCTWAFDDKYLWKRFDIHNIDAGCLSRITQAQPKLETKELSSSAYGNNEFKYIMCPGRDTFDLIEAIRRDHKLNEYKLNTVAKKFLNEHKVDLPYRELFKKLVGGPDDIAECAVYCIQDSYLVLRLILKLSILPNYMEMAKATYVPMQWLLLKGQQCKVFSLIVKEASKSNYLVPINHAPNNEEFKGATVLSPLIGMYYDPIAGLDFASLYPSIMMAYNMCYSTIITTPKMMEYVKKNNIPHETIEWDEEPETESLVQNKKHHSFTFVQIEDNNGVELEKGTRGLLGIILLKLSKGRKETKKLMKSENDPFIYEVLNGKQLAQKVTMNSIYGFTGVRNGMLPLKAIAASVTAVGRRTIDKTSQIAGEEFGALTVYGDSIPGYELITVNVKTPNKSMLHFALSGKDMKIEDFANNLDEEWQEYRGFKIGDVTIKNKEYKNLDHGKYFTYTEHGYKPIKKVIRHKTNKKLYKIKAVDCNGNIHEVTVTDGHSLILASGKMVKPEQLLMNDILHDYINHVYA